MSGGFLLIGLAAAAIARLRISEATGAFIKGMEEMVVAAFVVGFARGIQIVWIKSISRFLLHPVRDT